MNKFLYCVLAAGVLFDVGAGMYLWQLIGERQHQSVDAGPDHSKLRQPPRQAEGVSTSRSRPTYSIY